MAKGHITIDFDRCKGCELCTSVCPHNLLRMDSGLNARGYHPVSFNDPGRRCTGCGLCAVICPDAVFTVYRVGRGSDKAALV